MQQTSSVITMTVLPVLVLLCIGAISRKSGLLKPEGVAGLKSLVIGITLPAVLINAFYRANYTTDMVAVVMVMFATCLAALGVGFLLKKVIAKSSKLMPYLMTGFEAGMLGYALYSMLFADASAFAIVDLGQVLFVFTVYMSLLKSMDKKGTSAGEIVKDMLSSPVIIAIAVGVLLGITGLGNMLYATSVGGAIQAVLDFAAAPTAAVILVVIGFELKLEVRYIKSVLLNVVFRYIIMGILLVAALWILGMIITVTEQLKFAMILMFLLPPPFVLPVFVKNEQEGSQIAATLSLCTLVSIVLFTALTYYINIPNF